MAIFYALGDALVGNDEMRYKAAEGKLQKFQELLMTRPQDARLDFMFGTATSKNIVGSFADDKAGPIGFEPIGVGKPLTVQLRHIYTGNQAHGFWGDKDMLVASAMKSIATYDGAPRSVNFLVKETKNNQNFRTVDAVDKGTPLICYSPSLAQSSSVVTVEVMFDNFPEELFAVVSQAFSMAAGIPVFAPASAYLVAAGIVIKLLGNIGKSLSNGTPALRRTEEITFVTPGSQTAVANFALLIADDIEASVLHEYKVSAKGMLVRIDDEKQLYDGPQPYAVLSLDGRENADFKGFAPAAATAAQLDRFYNINDGGSQPLQQLIDAMKLYNDIKFREKAMTIGTKMKGLDKASKQYQDLLTQYNAYLGNIENDALKPPSQA